MAEIPQGIEGKKLFKKKCIEEKKKRDNSSPYGFEKFLGWQRRKTLRKQRPNLLL